VGKIMLQDFLYSVDFHNNLSGGFFAGKKATGTEQ